MADSASASVSAAATPSEPLFALARWKNHTRVIPQMGHDFVFYQITDNPEIVQLLGRGGGLHDAGMSSKVDEHSSLFVSDISGTTSRKTLFTRDEIDKLTFVLSTMGHEYSDFPIDSIIVCSGKFTRGEETDNIFSEDEMVKSSDVRMTLMTLGGTWSSPVNITKYVDYDCSMFLCGS